MGGVAIISFPAHSHIPSPSESQGILMILEDFLGTYSRHRTVFRSGFLFRIVILGGRPLGDRIQILFVIGSGHQPLENPLDTVTSISGTQLVVRPIVMASEVTPLRHIRPASLIGPWASCLGLLLGGLTRFSRPNSPTYIYKIEVLL